MSFSQPTRCLVRAARFAPSRSPASRCIHSSTKLLDDNPSKTSKSGPPAVELPTPRAIESQTRKQLRHKDQDAARKELERRVADAKSKLKPYTQDEREMLREKYSEEQMEALEAGEASIDPDDLARQGALRNDPMRIQYRDDYAQVDPVYDKRRNPEEAHYDPNLRFKDEDDFVEDWVKFIENSSPDDDPVELHKFLANTRMTVGKPEAELEPTDYTAPSLPILNDPDVRQQAKDMSKTGGEEITPFLRRLEKLTGRREGAFDRLGEYRHKKLLMKRVVQQTRMGKMPSMYSIHVVGDGKGSVGIGEGKSVEPDAADRIAYINALRNLTPIPRYEQRTIYGDVQGKVGATELTLYTRPPGFGIRCQAYIYEICMCAGITDIHARVTRSRNPMNVIKATMQALLRQRDPEKVARARGVKMVDVRKVYYAGEI